MMNTTKEIKEYYERVLVERLENMAKRVKEEGFTSNVQTHLRFLANDLKSYDVIESAFDAWHEEGEMQQERKGA